MEDEQFIHLLTVTTFAITALAFVGLVVSMIAGMFLF